MNRYKVVFERDESGAWIARIPAVRGCHTYGRTLGEARRRIREALGLFVRDARRAKLIDEVRLPAELQRPLAAARRAREKASSIQEESARYTVAAARELSRWLSLRDTGGLLGLSRQRVQQLTGRSARAARRTA